MAGTLSGSLDLTGLTPSPGSAIGGTGINPGSGTVFLFNGLVEFYAVTGPASFGPGGVTLFTSVDGSPFVLSASGDVLGVARGYASGTSLVATAFIAGATFASLGVTSGDYVYTLLNHETVTVSFAVPAEVAVPAPAALPVLAVALAVLGLTRRRRPAQG